MHRLVERSEALLYRLAVMGVAIIMSPDVLKLIDKHDVPSDVSASCLFVGLFVCLFLSSVCFLLSCSPTLSSCLRVLMCLCRHCGGVCRTIPRASGFRPRRCCSKASSTGASVCQPSTRGGRLM